MYSKKIFATVICNSSRFSTLYYKTSLEILHKYSIPSNIAKARIDGLTNTIL